MNFGLFFQNLTFSDDFILGAVGLALGFIALFLIFALILYIYTSLAYFAIAKRARLRSPGLAWIPAIGPLIIAYQASKMPWWPWLLLIGYLIPFVNFFTGLIFAVFAIIWHWKMFESIKRPGWWAILMIIPIVNLVILGIAAWGKK